MVLFFILYSTCSLWYTGKQSIFVYYSCVLQLCYTCLLVLDLFCQFFQIFFIYNHIVFKQRQLNLLFFIVLARTYISKTCSKRKLPCLVRDLSGESRLFWIEFSFIFQVLTFLCYWINAKCKRAILRYIPRHDRAGNPLISACCW